MELNTLTLERLTDPELSAREAGLRYVSDEVAGYTRRRKGRGFAYYRPGGELVERGPERDRLVALVIPPAWQEVWICADPAGHLQATGRDQKGRKQYRYHEEWERVRSEAKFHRMVLFGQRLPALREAVSTLMRKRTLSKEKVTALAVAVLDAAHVRVGNEVYTRKNGSFGLTTLRDEHLDVYGGTVTLRYTAKSGKEREVSFKDRRIARNLLRCQELPGQRLLQYVSDEDTYGSVESGDINAFLEAAMSEPFTAKDFRTWGGTVRAFSHLLDAGPPGSDEDAKQAIVDCIKAVARAIGNTPAVCRAYYVHPAILDAYRAGTLAPTYTHAEQHYDASDPHGLDLFETAALAIMTEYAGHAEFLTAA
ncbi:MAG: DNA topoisomerase IB [Bacteroidota bacterium]